MNAIVNNYRKIRMGVLVLLIASLPFYYQISNVLIIVGASLTLFKMAFTKQLPKQRPDLLSVLFIGFFFLECVGLLYTDSENLRVARYTLDRHQAWIFLPLLFLDLTIDRKDRETLLYTFVASVFFAVILCVAVNIQVSLTEYNTWMHEWRFSHNRFSEPLDLDAVYMGMYIAFSILIILHTLLLSQTLTRQKRTLLVAALPILIFGMVSTGARTSIATLTLLIIFFIVRYAFAKKVLKLLWFAVMIPIVVGGAVLLNPVVNTRFKDLLHADYDQSNYGSYFARLKIWIPGLEAIRENIWAGVGTGDHQAELNKKFAKFNYAEGIDVFNMHNQYLQTLLNFGLIGLLFLLTIFWVQLKRGLALKDWIYLSFLMLFMLGCLTETMLTRNKGFIFFSFFSLIFFRQNDRQGEKHALPDKMEGLWNR